jgi:hypothetical protein
MPCELDARERTVFGLEAHYFATRPITVGFVLGSRLETHSREDEEDRNHSDAMPRA